MLTNAHMGGMDTMSVFYDKCLETLYPPGTCGSFCNSHTFDCYLAEARFSSLLLTFYFPSLPLINHTTAHLS